MELRSALLFVGVIASSALLNSQTIAWEVNGVNAGATNPFPATTISITNITSAALTLGSGVTTSSAANTFGGSEFNQTSLVDAISGADYIAFSVTVNAGYRLSVSNISFNSGVGSATTFNGALLSGPTGFTSSDSLNTYSFSTAGAPAQSVSLSGVTALQSIVGTVEFRLYGWRDTSGTSTFRIRDLSGNDLVITGTTSPIPEPSAYAALAGLATLGLAATRRRRRAA
jgi:hypothetical protein